MFLNAWWGTTGDVWWNYLRKEVKGIDVFCFMETNDEFDVKCNKILSNFARISTSKKVVNEIDHTISVYVKKDDEILESEIISSEDEYTGVALFTKILSKNKTINIASVHGVAQPGDKLDNPKRLKQSEEIINFMKNIATPKIIGGDFNLDKNTESVRMFEKNGYRNLIEEYKVETTRNHLCWDVWHNHQLWADFLFISPDIKVKSFKVPQNEVSDHLPQILEFE